LVAAQALFASAGKIANRPGLAGLVIDHGRIAKEGNVDRPPGGSHRRYLRPSRDVTVPIAGNADADRRRADRVELDISHLAARFPDWLGDMQARVVAWDDFDAVFVFWHCGVLAGSVGQFSAGVRVITVFDGLLCSLAEGFLGSTL
jgi:hypothetical protein